MAADLQILITVDPDVISDAVNDLVGADTESESSIRLWVESNLGDVLNTTVQEAIIAEIAGDPFE